MSVIIHLWKIIFGLYIGCKIQNSNFKINSDIKITAKQLLD